MGTASLDGYFVTRSVEDKYSFHVLRLAVLDVKVTSNGVFEEPVNGVLLSVSGEIDEVYGDENTFRSNVKTHPNGTRSFTGLFPGNYFIRPVLKEYEFQPPGQSVKVLEGKPHSVHF